MNGNYRSEDNAGCYESVTIDGKTYKRGNETTTVSATSLFRPSSWYDSANVRLLTLTELNKYIGEPTDVDSLSAYGTYSDQIGFFKLENLRTVAGMSSFVYRQKSPASWCYWLASPYPGDANNLVGVLYDGRIGGYGRSGDEAGIRPVISLYYTYTFKDENSNGVVEPVEYW